MTRPDESSTVTLRSCRPPGLDGPLSDAGVCGVVLATLRSIAERNDVDVLDVQHDADAVTFTVRGPTLVAVALAAELRKVTDAWHRGRYGGPLWSEPT